MNSVFQGEKQMQIHVYMMHMYVEMVRLLSTLFYPYMFIWQAAIPNGISSFKSRTPEICFKHGLSESIYIRIYMGHKKPSSERFNLHNAN